MIRQDFDDFRNRYLDMPYSEQVKFYSRVYADYPVQNHCSIELAKQFFEKYKPKSVIEIGGWTGNVALEILNLYPQIFPWHNYEVCYEAIINSINHPRYVGFITNDYFWNLSIKCDAECLFMSHSLEHMTLDQLGGIVSKLSNLRCVYFEAPIAEDHNADWTGDFSTHILKESWKEVEEMMLEQGLNCSYRNGYVRYFDV